MAGHVHELARQWAEENIDGRAEERDVPALALSCKRYISAKHGIPVAEIADLMVDIEGILRGRIGRARG